MKGFARTTMVVAVALLLARCGKKPNDEVTLTYYVNGTHVATVTDTTYSYEDTLRYLVLGSGDFRTAYDSVATASDDSSWSDGFEATASGEWPSEWVAEGNATAQGNGVIDSLAFSGQKSLQLKGVYGGNDDAVACRDAGLARKVTIDVSVFPTGEGQRGAHPYCAGAMIKVAPTWAYYGRWLFQFSPDDGHLYGINQHDLGTFTPRTWYHLTVVYERP